MEEATVSMVEEVAAVRVRVEYPGCWVNGGKVQLCMAIDSDCPGT